MRWASRVSVGSRRNTYFKAKSCDKGQQLSHTYLDSTQLAEERRRYGVFTLLTPSYRYSRELPNGSQRQLASF
ncbi:hypothetical protein EmuJ_001152400 [Echinococcus multilocularis]|uniref:Uncharacterized protein n=1 Tax=Echinococcus multilocularis TaxID=6211 RepID=A0A068YKC5_ECHMU|nr:hypothetical protein EmuJ_001152400 [Echinococcus multilocularis]